MAVVVDAGGLIAIDRRDRQVGSLLRVAERNGVRVMSSAAAVAQAWRSGARQATLARVLAGVHIASLDDRTARQVGELLGANGTSDVADAHLALLVSDHDVVLTGDEPDIVKLLSTRGIRATVHAV